MRKIADIEGDLDDHDRRKSDYSGSPERAQQWIGRRAKLLAEHHAAVMQGQKPRSEIKGARFWGDTSFIPDRYRK